MSLEKPTLVPEPGWLKQAFARSVGFYSIAGAKFLSFCRTRFG